MHGPKGELFETRVQLCVEPIGDVDITTLPTEEQALVEKAVPKRRREFAAGRSLARRMLQARGLPDGPLLRGEHGAVQWPAGVQASISHSGPWVGVAMTTAPELVGVGLDIEHAEPLDEAYWHVILTEDDMCHLRTWPEDERAKVAKRMFAAKEAAYKAQHPQSKQFLPFSAMWIAVGSGMDTFEAHFRVDAAPWGCGHILDGRFVERGDYLFTGVAATSDVANIQP